MWPGTGERLPLAAIGLAGGGRAARRALTLGPLITAVIFGVAALARAAGKPSFALIAAGVVLCALPFLAAMLSAKSRPLAVYGCACGLIAAAWLAATALGTVWSAAAVAALLAPAVAATAIYPAIRQRHDRAAELARQAREAADAHDRLQRKWPDLLERIGQRGIRYAGQEDTLAGYQVHLRLPGSGRVTFQGLAGSADRLEVAARMRHGSLRFERGDQAHEVILHVTERDVLARTIPLPPDGDSLSIADPIPLGLYQDGQVCAVTLREVATLIVGLRGSGKSNLLNVLLAQLARCPDVLIFAIDLKGGRMAAPWIMPWLDQRAERPVIDWLATDRDEAERMLRALLRAVDARARSFSGGEKVSPSASQPAILLVCDEVAVLLGIGTGGHRPAGGGVSNLTLAGLATRLVMTGRSEAVDLIMATQRGTVTMTGSADLKSQCALRIGLGVASESDARLIIPDNVRIAADLARLRHPGSGIVQQGRYGRVLPVKFYRMEHDQIGKVAERFGWLRPEPDPLVAQALGDDYRTRWTRYLAGQATPAIPAAPPVLELTAGPAGDGEADPARWRLVAMLRSAGVKGMTVRGISERLAAEGEDVSYETIHGWLTAEAAAGRAESASYGRWKWRSGVS